MTLRTSESGSTLTTVLIGGFLGVAVVGGLLTNLTKSMRATKDLEEKTDLVDLRRSMTGSVDCAATRAAPGFSAEACESATTTAHGPIEIRSKNGSVMVSRNNANPTVRAGWMLRGICDANGISIEAAKPRTGVAAPLTAHDDASFRKNLMGHPLKWGVPGLRLSKEPLCPLRNDASPTTSSTLCGDPFCAEDAPTRKVVVGDLRRSAAWNAFASGGPGDPYPSGPHSQCGALGQSGGFEIRRTQWVSEVHCPAGWTPVGGGANCQVPPHGGTTLGSMLKQGTSPAWITNCCVYDGRTTTDSNAGRNAAFVICIPE